MELLVVEAFLFDLRSDIFLLTAFSSSVTEAVERQTPKADSEGKGNDESTSNGKFHSSLPR